MSTLYWMVPTHVDALFLAEDQSVPGPMADFSRQPWTDGTQDYNSANSFTSAELLSAPFEDSNFRLKAGAHLHWSLPDSLTRILVGPDGNSEYVSVPDRWLISRTSTTYGAQQWIVESSYLFPPGSDLSSGGITMPQTPEDNGPPFSYMGRSMQLNAWSAAPSESYAATLTAIGYGEATFAAFYPNCHSVFGFYDGEITAVTDDLSYTIIGYFADPANDCFGQFVAEYQADFPNATTEELQEAIQSYFGWSTTDSTSAGIPQLMMCYATISFAPDPADTINLPELAAAADLTIGQTGTEALSARLAYTIDPNYKDLLEDQLEAIQMADYLGSKQIDVSASFFEERHTNGFLAQQSGISWSIYQTVNGMNSASAEDSQQAAGIPLPDAFGDLLNLLNVQQQQYDTTWWKIRGRQQQLFADWYKYQLSLHPPQDLLQAYPSPALIKWFQQTRSLPEIAALYAQAGTLTYQTDANGIITGASTTDEPETIAWQLSAAVNGLISQLNAFNQSTPVTTAGAVFTLNGGGAARYWVPRDPVVLVSGAIAQPSERHGMDATYTPEGTLPCHITSVDGIIDSSGGGNSIDPALLATIAGWDGDPVGFYTWTAQPWNPFMLEWLVEMKPVLTGSNFENASQVYSETFITSNYDLPVNSPDLVPKNTNPQTATASLFYMGRSILTQGAGDILGGKILDAIETNILPDYFAANPSVQFSDDYMLSQENADAVTEWYQDLYYPDENEEEMAADPDFTMLRAWQEFLGMNFLSQSLDGFTSGLRQLKNTLQLPVADPTGFPSDQDFATLLAQAIGNENTQAPLPLNAFSPLRSGNLVVRALRIIDNFGQVAPLTIRGLLSSEPMESATPNTSYLAPRLAQPARLQLRWLSSLNDMQEMNDMPVTNPVCGWMVPNLFDYSLAFYDNEGQALGSIDYAANWQPAPGSEAAIYYLPNISDPHLLKVISWLMERGAAFVANYLAAIENALENIQPENYEQNSSLSVLAGQPLAIIRTRMNLEFMGEPAINQSWLSLRQDLNRNYRDTALAEYIRFPVRLGEYEQQNDGLIGYWIEEGDKFADNLFYAPQTNDIDDPNIITHGESSFTIDLAPAEPPVYMTLVFDPRGKLHATSGILPVKEIDIPPAHYAQALQQIEVSFLNAPLVTDGAQLFLPLPSMPGYNWSWVQRQSDNWEETTNIKPLRTDAPFSVTQTILEGWMKLNPSEETDINSSSNT